MITNKFNSIKNKNVIKSIINDDIIQKYEKNINNNFDGMIQETMDYVLSKVNSVPPKGMKEEEYLFLMNKKVYDIVTPLIEKNINNLEKNQKKKIITENTNPKINNPLRVTESSFTNRNTNNLMNKIREKQPEPIRNDATSGLQDKIFDPILLKNFETPPLMDYPVPATTKFNNENSDLKIKSLENERSTIIPKIKPIDFSIKETKNNNQVNTTQLYNELLTTYNTQVDNMNNFENNQKNLNKNIEQIENVTLQNYKEEERSFTPINLLRDPKLTNNFFEVKDNNSIINNITNSVAYNRNDIETFIDFKDLPREEEPKSSSNPKTSNDSFLNANTFNNGLMYNTNNGNNLEFGPTYYPNNPIMIDEPKFKIIEKKFFLSIDSADRDLYEYPNPSVFQVKFAPSGNSLRVESFYDKYNTLIIQEKIIIYGDNSNTSIRETFDNVKSIYCSGVVVPNGLLFTGYTSPNIEIDSYNNFFPTKGVGLCIYGQSYLYLTIPELRGTYTGSNSIAQNAFAKLLVYYGDNALTAPYFQSLFTTLNTSNENEKFMYDPVTLGKIDKLTLNLLNKNGIPYNFGIDKLFINNFLEGDLCYDGICGNPFITTIINVQSINEEYSKFCGIYNKRGPCNNINFLGLNKGDLLYFYNTRPNCDQIVFLEENITISKLKYDKTNLKLSIYLHYLKIIDNKEEKISVNMKDVLGNNVIYYQEYYIIFYDIKKSYYYFLKIDSIQDNVTIVHYFENLPVFKNYSNIKIGIAKNNPRGQNNDDQHSLFYKGGYNVISLGNQSGNETENKFQCKINFPYYNLPEFILNSSYYYPGEIFFIQQSLQISYNFEITMEVKDYDKLKSGLNESGNN